MDWTEALDFCRTEHSELATLRNEEDTQGTLYFSSPYWIGLHRDSNDPAIWNWADGEQTTYTDWGPQQPNNLGGVEDCVAMLKDGWHDVPCSESFYVLCHQDFSSKYLVKEAKTWEEAMEHCRTFTTDPDLNYVYNLPAVDEGNKYYSMWIIAAAETEEVWTGLRFLAGEWLWVNGRQQSNDSLPACPPSRVHCGTMSKTGEFSIKDCEERRNLICMPLCLHF